MTRDQVIEHIKKLQRMTVEHGCSENEANMAATRLAKLMDAYAVEMTEVEMRTEVLACVAETFTEIVPDGRTFSTLYTMASTIGALFSCKTWQSRGTDNLADEGEPTFTINVVNMHYFGFPADVTACISMSDIIQVAITGELAKWHALNKRAGKRQQFAFRQGMADRIQERLRELTQEKSKGALVVVKTEAINSAFEQLGLRLRYGRAPTVEQGAAYHAGRAAGSGVNLGGGRSVGAATKLIGGRS